ncbi:chemotaxis protein CheB [Ruminococcus albus]|uniref:Stage 0 sporulation protein A homolog n=1 Tax=Ruminococcus albus (strain ATCC 27210 / DSM 20455 / JCM 14654 / NCDO 2250 / 7) TaxID=697329 RepID=E6UBQ0_RUMA7|nr:chemotaxis protein CheB [Ruminococcus albus]ADU20642.1 CheB methylesterase [Ruminococcus albus 7 = DSM 20455]
MTIYIISDNIMICELLSARLAVLLPAGTIIATGMRKNAKAMIAQSKPSAIVLDIDGGEASDAAAFISDLCPRYSIPIIAVTANKGPRSSLFTAGAIDVVQHQIDAGADEKFLQRVSQSIKSCTSAVRMRLSPQKTNEDQVIVIGGSTGSTNALPELLKDLPSNSPPIVCVLHMPVGYTKIYAAQLNASLPLDVSEAVSGTYLTRGMVVIAEGGRHLRLFRDRKGYFITSEEGVKVNGHCPSVDVLFSSAAYAAKENAIGIILTGMGCDGAKGMLDMRKLGAYNIAESEKTAVVYGMPRVAAENGAANISLPLDEIAAHVIAKIQ